MTFYREFGVTDPDWKSRFASFIHKETVVTSKQINTPCWLWQGWLDKYGYGRFSFPKDGYTSTGKHRRQHEYAHRIAYEIVFGVIPKGMELDHLCYTANCVRPSHVELVTHAENIRRRTVKDHG